MKFCSLAQLVAVATTEEVLCKFVAQMASEELRHQIIKSFMAWVCHLHIVEGLGDLFLPALPRLRFVLRGVKSSWGGECASSHYVLRGVKSS